MKKKITKRNPSFKSGKVEFSSHSDLIISDVNALITELEDLKAFIAQGISLRSSTLDIDKLSRKIIKKLIVRVKAAE